MRCAYPRASGRWAMLVSLCLAWGCGGQAGAAGGAGGSGGGGSAGTGGGTGGTSGASATRLGSACPAGAAYPAPDLTATPKLLYQASGTANSGICESPLWLSTHSLLLFSDVAFAGSANPSQLLKLTPPSTVATYLADAGVNGMAVDRSGVVFACSHKLQGIVKLDFASATLATVVDNVDGKKFNSPNDLIVRSDGTIYFTDPDFQLGSRTSETGMKGVYRASPSGTVSLVDGTFAEPNGITLSPDEAVLYAADYNGNVVRTFAVAADGGTSGRKDFVKVSSPDGLAMDCLGNLYVASGSPGVIQVYAPSGSKLGSVTVAPSLSNMAFGGTEGKTLYITAGRALYSLDMNLPGYHD
jgi:gluconolactonase